MNSDYPIDYEDMQTPSCGYGNLGLCLDELYNTVKPIEFKFIKCPKCQQDFDCAFHTELCSECALITYN